MRKLTTTYYIETDCRPANWNPHQNCQGDCTTRAMAYCLNGEMDYNQIEAEQYRLAKLRGTVRNATGTWDIIMKIRGYKWIKLNHRRSRGKVADMMKSFHDHAMIAHSTGHVAAIHNGFVRDNWNSTGGLVDFIMVHHDDYERARRVLILNGLLNDDIINIKL